MSERRSAPFMPRFLAIAGIAAASLALVACQSGPGRVRSPQQRLQAFKVDHDAYGQLGYRLDWTGFPVLTVAGPMKFVEFYDDVVVAQEPGNTVTVLEASNGQVRWSDQPASSLTRFVGLDREDNRLYVSSEAELFVLDLQTGAQLDRQKFEKLVSTEPVLAGNLLIYGTGTGEILAHLLYSSIDGVKLWGYDMTGAIRGNPVKIGEGAVGAVTQAGELAFVEPSSGQLIARGNIFGGVASNPVADGQRMYIASLDQSLYAIDSRTAEQVWRHRTAAPLDSQPTLHQNRLYIDLPGEGLTAFEAARGERIWSNKEVTGTVIGVTGAGLLVWNGREAMVVDPRRGDLIERVSLPNVQQIELDRFEGGNMYAVTKDGLIAKFVPTSRNRVADRQSR